MDKPTPRVSSAQLATNAGSTVRLVGKVLQHTGDSALVEACDHGQVPVQLTPGSAWGSKYVEVIGRVSDDGTGLQELNTLNLGDSFDMDSYAQLLHLIPKFPELFGQ
ncbi:replication factor A protein 3 [Piptocephalis cylindrospora]|uniref:Replication factor A protein 3 n=1 Tax=Piptocephalis cylindrospora TaxID=1907219 RepID=A0A4P9Y7V2_9FUNG|nr:replication factor A protein 3 [Piptocephalis cylindrospora]|eukprot:RKP15178.1 replication factor A protein 3 [Piptocephalis cylindrospora]